MPVYPFDIYSPRAKENYTDVIYHPEQKYIGYVEDVVYLDDEVVSIETELGLVPKSGYANVAARLDDFEARIYALEHP